MKALQIEKKSFEIIESELGEFCFNEPEMTIVKRVIHATADFDFSKNLRFSKDAVQKGIRAIKSGMDILVDVNMLAAGINKRKLAKFNCSVKCHILHPETLKLSEQTGETRSETAIQLGATQNIGIVAVGNAPTALYKVMELIKAENFHPELVIGVPVGFVKAVESKDALFNMAYPFITSLGRKGGSSVAAAIVNALIYMTE